VSAFQAVDADARRRFPARGGTTATLALACGWELLVANVGDSCAYLDTGSEVLQVRAWADVLL
jgi:serine/threonine protein phosphatase PrpC